MFPVQSVLFVEDEVLVRDLVAIALEDAGFEVAVAENGAAAFDALDDDADPFCVIVTDVDLGAGPDGWAVAQRARELNNELPVIYVSGGSSHEWRSKGVPHSLLIPKPFSMAQIVGAVSSMVATVRKPPNS